MNQAPQFNPHALQNLRKRNPGLTTNTYHFIGRNPSYTSINNEALKRIEQVKKENLDEIDLSGLAISSLPSELFGLIGLRTINLSANNLSTLPQEIGQLRELRTLVANENPIETVHENIGALQNLITLALERCQLKIFPEGILAIHSLKSLQLEGNQISEIPLGLKDMNIEEINLMGNPVTNVPEEFLDTTSARLFHFFNDREQSPDNRNFTAS